MTPRNPKPPKGLMRKKTEHETGRERHRLSFGAARDAFMMPVRDLQQYPGPIRIQERKDIEEFFKNLYKDALQN